jgi:hypothetical protein
VKLILINDTHCGIRNSSEIFLNNANLFYNEVLFPYMLEHDITQILHLGDVFDNRKFINFKALHSFRRNFLAQLRTHGFHMDVFCGNHDTFWKSTNELNSLKELLGHYMKEVRIIHEPTEIDYDGVTWGMVPWITADNEAASRKFLETTKAAYIGGHFELNGFEVTRGVEMQHGMDPTILDRFSAVYSGHFHTASSKGNIHYLGSQMEFFWSDAGDPKCFHVFDTETLQLTKVRNPHTLFQKIYYDDVKNDYSLTDFSAVENKFVQVVVINKTDLFMFDRVIDKIQNYKIHELKIAENFGGFGGDSVADSDVSLEDTISLLASYVDAVDTDLDKDRIKTMMVELMQEAQSMEIA